MTRHQPLRLGACSHFSDTILDWPKTALRMLIAIPAALHVLVLLSIPAAADVILRTVGAAPLSPGGRLALANARIVLMLVASLSTIIVGVALALAIRRQLRRVRDAALAAPGIPGSLPAGWVVRPVPSFERDPQPRISVVLTPRFTDRTSGPHAVGLKVVARRDGDS